MLYIQLKSAVWDTEGSSVILEITIQYTTGLVIQINDYNHVPMQKNKTGYKNSRGAFLFTRMKSLDEDNYKKLTRVVQYLRDTQHITLQLSQVTIHSDGSTINTLYIQT